jgi:predicted DNA-binding transcriptional regulator YafY
VADVSEPVGWRTIDLPIESVDHAFGELLALGTDVEVLAPADLRARLTETARELALMYNFRVAEDTSPAGRPDP